MPLWHRRTISDCLNLSAPDYSTELPDVPTKDAVECEAQASSPSSHITTSDSGARGIAWHRRTISNCLNLVSSRQSHRDFSSDAVETHVLITSTPVSMKSSETEEAALQAPEFDMETVSETLSPSPIVRLPPSTTPYKNVEPGARLALLDGLYRHVRNLRVDSGHRPEIPGWQNPRGIMVQFPGMSKGRLCRTPNYEPPEDHAKALREETAAKALRMQQRKRFGFEKTRGLQYGRLAIEEPELQGKQKDVKNFRCRTILVHSARAMAADEVKRELFDPRDSSKIIDISREMQSGALAGRWVRAVHFTSTEIMIGVLARNPTREAIEKHLGLQMAADMTQKYARQDISTILETVQPSTSETTLGLQALHVLSKIIYVQDNRKRTQFDRFVSAEKVKVELFLSEDVEKIIQIQGVDQDRWIVHFENPAVMLDVLRRLHHGTAKRKKVRMDRFWYFELQTKLSESEQHEITSQDSLYAKAPNSEVSAQEVATSAEPELSQCHNPPVMLEEKKEVKRPESAHTLSDGVASSTVFSKHRDYDRTGEVSSDDEFFDCSEVLHSR